MSKQRHFKFALGERVMSTMNQRNGQIIARTEYLEGGEPMYQVRHDTVVDRQPIDGWYGEHALVEPDPEPAEGGAETGGGAPAGAGGEGGAAA